MICTICEKQEAVYHYSEDCDLCPGCLSFSHREMREAMQAERFIAAADTYVNALDRAIRLRKASPLSEAFMDAVRVMAQARNAVMTQGADRAWLHWIWKEIFLGEDEVPA